MKTGPSSGLSLRRGQAAGAPGYGPPGSGGSSAKEPWGDALRTKMSVLEKLIGFQSSPAQLCPVGSGGAQDQPLPKSIPGASRGPGPKLGIPCPVLGYSHHCPLAMGLHLQWVIICNSVGKKEVPRAVLRLITINFCNVAAQAFYS